MRDATRAVHAGLPAPERDAPLLGGPVFAAPYHLAGDVEPGDVGYARYGNPTWTAYEQALGELEGGEAVLFPSGTAAVAAVLLPLLTPGDVLVGPSDGYPAVRFLAAEHLEARGVEVRLVATDTEEVGAAMEGATLVWLETPSNPGLDVVDVRRLAQEAGAMVAVDNSLATPLGQKPLELGADVSVAAATKALSGHADLLLGYVATREPSIAVALRAWRGQSGAIPGPMEAWLAHRALPTLALRLDRQQANALALAEALAAREDVAGVRYPGRPGDPAHAVASGQMERFGPLVRFDLGDAERAGRFLAGCDLVVEATSFGGVHTTAERRARWGYGDGDEGVIRLSAGIEDPRDLVADVTRALDRAARGQPSS